MEFRLRTEAPPFPTRFESVKDLCFEVVRNLSPAGLRSPRRQLGAGAQLRPLEAQYQDEFYRACSTVLGDMYLTSEWTGKTTGGRVDFQITSKGWAIECLRDGDKLEEHIAGFQERGKYYKWITSGEIKDYIILDFRRSRPETVRGNVISCPIPTFDEC